MSRKSLQLCPELPTFHLVLMNENHPTFHPKKLSLSTLQKCQKVSSSFIKCHRHDRNEKGLYNPSVLLVQTGYNAPFFVSVMTMALNKCS